MHVGKMHLIQSTFFLLFRTDAHNYKIIRMLKTIKIPTIAPTCFDDDEHNIIIIVVLAKHEIAP